MFDTYKRNQMMKAKQHQYSVIYCDDKIDFDKQSFRL